MEFSLSKFNLGKYRGILISVALFLLLDASVLLLNFFISFQISDDAVGVNLAGRQRMLSQRIAKSLYAMETEFREMGQFSPETLNELELSTGLFDETFYAFYRGGMARGASGTRVALKAVKDTAALDSLQNAELKWLDYKKAIIELTRSASLGNAIDEKLSQALDQARANNLPLLNLMNDFTVALENIATSKANRLRWIQTIGISLAILNFLFIMFHFIRQLRESDHVLEQARKETIEILNTVNEGLFLVDRDLKIGTQYSKQLEHIIGTRKLAGERLTDVLQALVNKAEAKTTVDFIGLLFNPKVKEKLIGDLNPLNQVEVNIQREGQSVLNRFLRFSFSRAISRGEISHVLVTVTDITDNVLMSRELAEVRENTDKQVEMLTGLLHANPSLLQDFIASAYRTYSKINNILKASSKTESIIKTKLIDIFIHVHNFKGEAVALKLDTFADKANIFESEIVRLKNKVDLTGNDFLGLTVFLDELISYTQQVDSLAERLASYGAGKPPTAVINFDQWQPLYGLVDNLAKTHNKAVALVCSGLSEVTASNEFLSELKATLIQLLRNCVVHGIETKEDRIAAQKPGLARIDIRAAMFCGELEITVEDDGAGFDYEALRRQALKSGRWDSTEIEAWDRKRLMAVIFQTDISTAKGLSQDAGRGIGMPAILSWVNENGGKLRVSSRPGCYTRFVISLSLPEAGVLAA